MPTPILNCNPKMHSKDLEKALAAYDSRLIWVASTGTTAKEQFTQKLVGLSRQAIECSAASSVSFLGITAKDRILNSLPEFHIAAISAHARAAYAGAEYQSVYGPNFRWNPTSFYKLLSDEKISICSLVPTQIFDLVQLRKKCPSHLRLCLVGGGALSNSLLQEARALSWPVLTTYGATETSSQVATTDPEEIHSLPGSLKRLPHVKFQRNDNSLLQIKSESLFSCYAFWDAGELEFEPIQKNKEGYWTTEDLVELDKDYLKVLGRGNRFAKVLGENVNLAELELSISSFLKQEVILLPLKDERKGEKIVLISDSETSDLEGKLKLFNSEQLGFRRVSEYYILPILRAENHKPLYAAMLENLLNSISSQIVRTLT